MEQLANSAHLSKLRALVKLTRMPLHSVSAFISLIDISADSGALSGCKRAEKLEVLHCASLKQTVVVISCFSNAWQEENSWMRMAQRAAVLVTTLEGGVCSSSPGCWFLTWELPLSAESHLGCHGNGSGTGWQCVCVRCIMKGRRDMGPHLNAWLNLYNSSLCSLQLCWSQAPGILQPQWMCASQHFFILLTLLRVDTDTKFII